MELDESEFASAVRDSHAVIALDLRYLVAWASGRYAVGASDNATVMGWSELPSDSVLHLGRVLWLLVNASAITIVGLVLVWSARVSFVPCPVDLGGGCFSDPKLMPAVVSTIVISALFAGLAIATIALRDRLPFIVLRGAVVSLGVLCSAGAMWTFVTGGF